MKTYMCDMCGCFADDLFRRVHIREVKCAGEKPGKKIKIHLCSECWVQVADISRKKRSDKNDR